MKKPLTDLERSDIKYLLGFVQGAQAEYWDALRNLEEVLTRILGEEIELDSTLDYENNEVDTLLEILTKED